MAYKLTPLGENRALKVGSKINAESAIISYLYQTRDPCETEEIAGEVHLSDESVQKAVNRLISAGYVKEVG